MFIMTVYEGASNLQLLEVAGSFLLKLTEPPPAIQQQPLGICAHKKETFIWARDSHRVRSSSIHHSLRLETTQMFTWRTGDRPRLCASVPQNHKSSARGQAVPLAVAWAKLTDTEGTATSPLHKDQRSWLCGGGGVTVGAQKGIFGDAGNGRYCYGFMGACSCQPPSGYTLRVCAFPCM